MDVQFPYGYDFENLIDDLIFLLFLIGNDFLPKLPSMNIRNGAIDALFLIYKYVAPSLDGYLTENGKLVLNRVNKLFICLSWVDEQFLIMNEKDKFKSNSSYSKDGEQKLLEAFEKTFANGINPNEESEYLQMQHTEIVGRIQENPLMFLNRVKNQKLKNANSIALEEANKGINYESEGYKARYYSLKFRLKDIDQDLFETVSKEYIKGLCWVMEYYYNGCSCWHWYYPFYYAPLALDLRTAPTDYPTFEQKPAFSPAAQLLAVMPPACSNLLPECLRKAMTSSICKLNDMYPSKFEIDFDGNIASYMGVKLLPFVEADRILGLVEESYSEFTEEEKKRNKEGEAIICLGLKADEEILGSYGISLVEKAPLVEPEHELELDSVNKDSVRLFTFTASKGDNHSSKLLAQEDKHQLNISAVLTQNKSQFSARTASNIVKEGISGATSEDLKLVEELKFTSDTPNQKGSETETMFKNFTFIKKNQGSKKNKASEEK